jgi:XTP/dITP diphosphohydrolase
MSKTIVVGTKNKDKLRELSALLRGARIKVLSLNDFPECGDVVEDGKTFEANASKKARIYSKHTGLLTLADDSGLRVDVLKGRPGVYSARFAGKGCLYQDNNKKILSLMAKVPGPKRKAKFVCVVAIYDNGKRVRVVRGECEGRISFFEKGKNGFGYDPVFIPKGFSKTFAELSASAKHKISHRGKALQKARQAILFYCAKP